MSEYKFWDDFVKKVHKLRQATMDKKFHPPQVIVIPRSMIEKNRLFGMRFLIVEDDEMPDGVEMLLAREIDVERHKKWTSLV